MTEDVSLFAAIETIKAVFIEVSIQWPDPDSIWLECTPFHSTVTHSFTLKRKDNEYEQRQDLFKQYRNYLREHYTKVILRDNNFADNHLKEVDAKIN